MSLDALDNIVTAEMGPEEAAVNAAIAALGEEYGNDAVIADVEPSKLLKLATTLYKYGISSNNLLAGDEDEEEEEDEDEDEDDEEDEDEDEEDDEEEEDERRIVNENAPPLDERYYQFGHEEEEDLVSEDEDDVSGFTPAGFEQYMVGDPFQNSLELLEIIKKKETGEPLFFSDVYDLTGNNFLELEDFESAISAYEKAIELMKLHYGKEDALHEDITEAYLKLCEALKWAQDTERYGKYLKTVLAMIEKRIDQRKSKDVEKDREAVLELKEDLDDIKDSHADIREKHPEFDSILKRALGQLLSPEEIEAGSGSAVNDLSSMVKKKKPKH